MPFDNFIAKDLLEILDKFLNDQSQIISKKSVIIFNKYSK